MGWEINWAANWPWLLLGGVSLLLLLRILFAPLKLGQSVPWIGRGLRLHDAIQKNKTQSLELAPGLFMHHISSEEVGTAVLATLEKKTAERSHQEALLHFSLSELRDTGHIGLLDLVQQLKIPLNQLPAERIIFNAFPGQLRRELIKALKRGGLIVENARRFLPSPEIPFGTVGLRLGANDKQEPASKVTPLVYEVATAIADAATGLTDPAMVGRGVAIETRVLFTSRQHLSETLQALFPEAQLKFSNRTLSIDFSNAAARKPETPPQSASSDPVPADAPAGLGDEAGIRSFDWVSFVKRMPGGPPAWSEALKKWFETGSLQAPLRGFVLGHRGAKDSPPTDAAAILIGPGAARLAQAPPTLAGLLKGMGLPAGPYALWSKHPAVLIASEASLDPALHGMAQASASALLFSLGLSGEGLPEVDVDRVEALPEVEEKLPLLPINGAFFSAYGRWREKRLLGIEDALSLAYAEIRGALSDPAGAQAALAIAIELRGRPPGLLQARAFVLLELEDFKGALKLLQEAGEKDPSCFDDLDYNKALRRATAGAAESA